jgi:UDP-N-acetylmuramate--alanine ligase
MHIYFSGIGGSGIGPLALIAKQAGFKVSGSDIKNSQYIQYLKKRGISEISIGQTREAIAKVHQREPIDWLVYSSAISHSRKNHPEQLFCQEHGIRMSKRDEFINYILRQKKLKMIAIAGTHGKTTTTAMVVWLFRCLGVPVSYSVGAKINFGDMGHFEPSSKYFVYEADEFDRNFLSFRPFLSVITGLDWDHHEIFPTKDDYLAAFRQFINQSQQTILWQSDAKLLDLSSNLASDFLVESENKAALDKIKLIGHYNRLDAWMAVSAVSCITHHPKEKLIKLINQFPGVSRRFERLIENLYTDYAHTPNKIRGVMSVAKETAEKTGQKIIIIYEPLTNRRMHYMKKLHQKVFDGASKLYWVPTYLAREDHNLPVLTPAELIKYLDAPTQAIAQPMELNKKLKRVIKEHLQNGDLVIGLSGGGGGSLDEWLRKEFVS